MILLVGGTFDENGGKESYIVNQMYNCIRNKNLICHLENDGTTIEKILEVIEIQDDIGIIEYEKD